jgi:hypothetical protein
VITFDPMSPDVKWGIVPMRQNISDNIRKKVLAVCGRLSHSVV